jgi:hypothetical protein
VFNMTKFEIKELAKIEAYAAAGLGADFVARALSAMIRAARTNKSAAALREHAARLGVVGHVEFIA